MGLIAEAIAMGLLKDVTSNVFTEVPTSADQNPATVVGWEQEEAEKALAKADILLSQGRHERAIAILQKAERLQPRLAGLPEAMAVAKVCMAAMTLPGTSKCVCLVNMQTSRTTGPTTMWHNVLQVEPNAESSTIKKKYHQLALLLHPDKNGHPRAEDAFKLVSEAHAVMSDSTRRAAYLAKLAQQIRCRICRASDVANASSRPEKEATSVARTSNPFPSRNITPRTGQTRPGFSEKVKGRSFVASLEKDWEVKKEQQWDRELTEARERAMARRKSDDALREKREKDAASAVKTTPVDKVSIGAADVNLETRQKTSQRGSHGLSEGNDKVGLSGEMDSLSPSPYSSLKGGAPNAGKNPREDCEGMQAKDVEAASASGVNEGKVMDNHTKPFVLGSNEEEQGKENMSSSHVTPQLPVWGGSCMQGTVLGQKPESFSESLPKELDQPSGIKKDDVPTQTFVFGACRSTLQKNESEGTIEGSCSNPKPMRFGKSGSGSPPVRSTRKYKKFRDHMEKLGYPYRINIVDVSGSRVDGKTDLLAAQPMKFTNTENSLKPMASQAETVMGRRGTREHFRAHRGATETVETSRTSDEKVESSSSVDWAKWERQKDEARSRTEARVEQLRQEIRERVKKLGEGKLSRSNSRQADGGGVPGESKKLGSSEFSFGAEQAGSGGSPGGGSFDLQKEYGNRSLRESYQTSVERVLARGRLRSSSQSADSPEAVLNESQPRKKPAVLLAGDHQNAAKRQTLRQCEQLQAPSLGEGDCFSEVSTCSGGGWERQPGSAPKRASSAEYIETLTPRKTRIGKDFKKQYPEELDADGAATEDLVRKEGSVEFGIRKCDTNARHAATVEALAAATAALGISADYLARDSEESPGSKTFSSAAQAATQAMAAAAAARAAARRVLGVRGQTSARHFGQVS